jgi:two-component system nitrate/nitrite response regulator NarL
MTKLALYSVQPVLVAGLQTVLAPLSNLVLSGVYPTIDQLMEHVQVERPDVLLIELTEDVTLEALSKLRAAANAPVILWVDSISTEFAAQAIGVGVRGVLRKSLPIELQGKCLMTVANGELWVEKVLMDRLLCTKRVVLNPRERQLVGLLVQGMKNKEVGYALGITEGTVKVYLSRLYQRVGVKDRFELALFAMQNFYINRDPTSTSIAKTGKEEAVTAGGTSRRRLVDVNRTQTAKPLPGMALEKAYVVDRDPARLAS